MDFCLKEKSQKKKTKIKYLSHISLILAQVFSLYIGFRLRKTTTTNIVLPFPHYLLLFCIYSVLLVFHTDDTFIASCISQRILSAVETLIWLFVGPPLLRNLPGKVEFSVMGLEVFGWYI